MDREKVIKALECRKNADKRCGNPCEDIGLCHYATAIRGLDGEIYRPFICDRERICADAITLLKEQAWHLLTEDADGIIHGLPGDDGQYLMTDGKDFWIDDYVDGVTDGIFLDSGRDIREIKAWMYLPEFSMEGK